MASMSLGGGGSASAWIPEGWLKGSGELHTLTILPLDGV
jgi:hypothetical protein